MTMHDPAHDENRQTTDNAVDHKHIEENKTEFDND